MKLPHKIYSFKAYWVANYKAQKFLFYLRRGSYRTKNLVADEKYRLRSSLTYFKLSVKAILRSVGFAALLMYFEHWVTAWWNSHTDQLPGMLITIKEHLPKPTYPDDKEPILYLLSVIASVAGVTLALFYTILATLASTAYAKVHSSIRNLLIYDKDTQGYLRRLTNLTAFAITILLLMSFGESPGNLALSILVLFSLTTLFGILKIGMGVYNFFEPSTIAGSVVTKMIKTVNNATIDGQYWDDPSFQNHNYKTAFDQIENIKLITSLCITGDDLNETSFKSITVSSINLLQYYLSVKPKIPTTSLWFPEIYEHRSFFETDMSNRQMARKASSFVEPKKIRDNFWFEERIIGNVSSSFWAITGNKRIILFGDILGLLHPLLNDLGSALDVKNGATLLSDLFTNVKLISDAKVEPGETPRYADWINEMGMIESYALSVFSFQVKFLDRAQEFGAGKLDAEYAKIAWGKTSTIYSTDFIPDLYSILNELNEFVLNERFVEGTQVTPDWYLKQQISSNHLYHLNEKLPEAIRFLHTYLLSLASYFNENNNCLLSSFTAHVGLGLLSKYRYRLNQLQGTLNGLNELEILKKEFRWPVPDAKAALEQIDKFQQDCVKVIADNAERLSIVKWDSHYPDVFSQSFAVISDELTSSFLSEDVESFQLLYPALFKSTVVGFNNLRDNFKHYNRPLVITYQTVLETMEIAGYAYLYTLIYDEPLYWETVVKTWDDFFLPNAGNIEVFAGAYAYSKTPMFGIAINYGEKHQRGLVFKEVVRSNKTRIAAIDNEFVEPYLSDSRYSDFYGIPEIFLEYYLFTCVEAKKATTLVQRRLFDEWCHILESKKK
ncbi:hypothetical protein [Mucilaginibacter phyllosphaerae]